MKSVVCRMFDRIAPTYTLLNHILSFGLDFLWRRRVARTLDRGHPLEVLDLATGTGDLLISMLRRDRNITKAVGLDISENMLAVCRRRIARCKLGDRVTLVQAYAAETGLPDESFDAVTMAFGIRNVPDIPQTLVEMHRLLKPGGTVLILEFSLPRNRVFGGAYLIYLRYVVPFIGGLISRDKTAYQYLNRTIELFHQPHDFCGLIEKAAFTKITTTPLTFGTVSLYSACKPPPREHQ